MKMNKIFLFFIAFPILVSGQESSGLVVKTLILQDIFNKNPNFIIEKPIKSNNSIEFLAAFRNSDWINNGGEGPPIPNMFDCNGFTVGLSFRHYFLKRRIFPNAWHLSGLIRYNNTQIKNLEMYKGLHSTSRTVNIHRNGPEMGIIFGRQFLILKHITTELYIGTGAYMQFYDEDYISGNISETLTNEFYVQFRPYLGWSVGYYFKKKEKK
ncbi:MAG: hypothetical protein IT219_08050 [Bacteroidales bacterium]|nr:hypothetical protein [Bacteroidales bacterium]